MSMATTGKVVIKEIAAEESDQRIDNYLIRILKGVPKTRIYRILRKGEVRVNGGRKSADYRLKTGDKVRIPPIRVAERSEVKVNDNSASILLSSILYEDERFLLLNKPAGWAVHGGSGISLGIVESLRQVHPAGDRLELVHRLDRETSGCLLLSKRRSALKMLHELQRQRAWKKDYLALLAGAWQGGARTVRASLEKNVLRSGERVVRVSESGKPAESRFIPLEKGSNWTLVSIQLITGRTHQIRVHASHIGHPVAGDERYGDDEFNQWCRNQGLKRMFLHAYKVSIKLAELDREIKQSAPLDKNLKTLLRRIGCKREY